MEVSVLLVVTMMAIAHLARFAMTMEQDEPVPRVQDFAVKTHSVTTASNAKGMSVRKIEEGRIAEDVAVERP